VNVLGIVQSALDLAHAIVEAIPHPDPEVQRVRIAANLRRAEMRHELRLALLNRRR
jgi:hypothetical protein